MLHPFQQNDLTRDPRWRNIDFSDSQNSFFEEQTNALDLEFRNALTRGSMRPFVKQYLAVTERMLQHSNQGPALLEVFPNALERLVRYFDYLRLRSREHLDENRSVLRWQLDADTVRRAQDAAALQEREVIARKPYDLRSDPKLRAWLMREVRPVIEEYVGVRICMPVAEIRFASSTREGEPWPENEPLHPYEEFHFDELCYMQRMILYLNDVDECCGPYTYVDGSDRLEQNFVLRAFHQAVDRTKMDFYNEVDRQRFGHLPASFRGSDIVGRFAGPQPFTAQTLVQATGPAGQLILFDGFQLVHAGGFPEQGKRKAMFISFRYPRKKLADAAGAAARHFAARRLTRSMI